LVPVGEEQTTMSSIYPTNLPSDNDPFGDADEISDDTIAERAERTDDDFAGDDAVDITASDGPVLEDGDDLG
jgi:hypothetical protein